MGLSVVCALMNDTMASLVVIAPVIPMSTVTIRSGANANVNAGRVRATSHMSDAVTAPMTTGGIFRSRRCITSDPICNVDDVGLIKDSASSTESNQDFPSWCLSARSKYFFRSLLLMGYSARHEFEAKPVFGSSQSGG